MKKFIFFIVTILINPTSTLAAEISPTGTSIEVESYRCTVKGPRMIECQNIGRVCQEQLAKEKAQKDEYLGCALEEWKKAHPGKKCPDWIYAGSECYPLELGF